VLFILFLILLLLLSPLNSLYKTHDDAPTSKSRMMSKIKIRIKKLFHKWVPASKTPGKQALRPLLNSL